MGSAWQVGWSSSDSSSVAHVLRYETSAMAIFGRHSFLTKARVRSVYLAKSASRAGPSLARCCVKLLMKGFPPRSASEM